MTQERDGQALDSNDHPMPAIGPLAMFDPGRVDTGDKSGGTITKILTADSRDGDQPNNEPGHITVLLQNWHQDGNEAAFHELLDTVYHELRKLAKGLVRRESGSPFEATELIGEVYEVLAGKQVVDFQNRKHFFRIAAMAMRRVLIHAARHRNAQKRNGGLTPDTLNEELGSGPEDQRLLRLDEALKQLEALDVVVARIVELKFFGGYNYDEIAMILDVSDTTVKRKWAFAKSWIYQRIRQ